MYILPRRMKAMLAVVPAVLGRPLAVFGHFSKHEEKILVKAITSVADPDVFRPPGSGSISTRYGSGSGFGTFYH